MLILVRADDDDDGAELTMINGPAQVIAAWVTPTRRLGWPVAGRVLTVCAGLKWCTNFRFGPDG